MSKSNADTTAMLTALRQQILTWEKSPPGSREETEAAEASTRLMAQLDAALCDGAHLPVPWQTAQYPQEGAHDATAEETAADADQRR